MICFKCNSEAFDVCEANVRQVFRGEQFDVKAHVSVCKSCGWQTLGVGQADALRKKTVEEYRRKHGLLTSTEIKARREMLGMSQQAFAKFIDVSVASVKRWETGFVQEPVYDRLIRAKCDFVLLQPSISAAFCVPEGIAIAQLNYLATTVLINSESHYPVFPIAVRSNPSRFTSHVTGDAMLAETSKKWREDHSKPCDFQMLS
jgi:putative zinc finger/helix-turn-helix YgiT family protein